MTAPLDPGAAPDAAAESPPSAPAAAVELQPGMPFCSLAELNRLTRRQGLDRAIAQAWVMEEIQQAVPLTTDLEHALIRHYLEEQNIRDDTALERFLAARGLDHDDLRCIATKGYRLNRFQQQVFRSDLEIHFLETKLDRDQVEYSLLRTADEGLAFELHQRLVEGEASFEELAPRYSEGPERHSGGRIGPLPITEAHPELAEKLRISQPGQLWPPFFVVDTWIIIRLEQRQNAQLDEQLSQQLLDELFRTWLNQRVAQLLKGQTPAPLPRHLLDDPAAVESEQG